MNDDGYSVRELSQQTPAKWDSLLSSYTDYNLYQSYGWGEFKKTRGWDVFRLVCYKHDKDVGLLQCIYRYYKFLKIYVVWAPGGPVFLKDVSNIDLNSLYYLFTKTLDKFKNYKYYLRIYPMQKYDSRIVLSIRKIGFQRPIENINQGFTYHINTSLEEARILDNLSSNWRHNLKRALKEGLKVECSDSLRDLAEFYKIYLEMTNNKKIRIYCSLADLILIKNNLPPAGALYLFISKSNDVVLSGRVICIIGKKAYDLLAGVTCEGRKRYASYLLVWEIINWCRNNNIEYLDLSGIDPFDNKEVFNFKIGLGGQFIEHIGEWEFSNNWLLRLTTNLYVSKFIKD